MGESSKSEMRSVQLSFPLNNVTTCGLETKKQIMPYDTKLSCNIPHENNSINDNDDEPRRLRQIAGPGENVFGKDGISENFKCLQTDDLNIYISDLLISSAEKSRWEKLKAHLDFSRPIDPQNIFKTFELYDEFVREANSINSQSQFDPLQKNEGNSIFYDYSAMFLGTDELAQQPTTSRSDCSCDNKPLSQHSSGSESRDGALRGAFSSREWRDSVRDALFLKYFGQRGFPGRSSSAYGTTMSESNRGVVSPSCPVAIVDENGAVELVNYAEENASGSETTTNNAEDDLNCVASFLDFSDDLVTLPNEICDEHRLVRTTSGKQLIRRRRRRHSSSSSSTSSTSLRGAATAASRRSWAPPKLKFIYDLSTINYKDIAGMLSNQDSRCAGCSRRFDNFYAKRSRICYYYSKIFCQCCHQGAKFVIPAQILHKWNFKEFLVCDTALSFLRDNADQPVFNVPEINPALYGRVKVLRKTRDLRTQVSHMWQYVQMCVFAERIETSHGHLKTMFTSIPRRFLELESVNMFSILDFVGVFNRNFIEMLEPIANAGRAHIVHCPECRQRAFICQICGNDADLLFPFQLERVYRCESCGTLMHTKCRSQMLKTNRTTELDCSKCERIRRNRIRQSQRSPSQKSDKCESE